MRKSMRLPCKCDYLMMQMKMSFASKHELDYNDFIILMKVLHAGLACSYD
jgi:hypothetical protein